MAQKLEHQITKFRKKWKEKQALVSEESDNHDDESLLRDLSEVKQELVSLKLDVDSTLKAKSRAEMEIEASVAKKKSHLQYAEELRNEIEQTNEEQLLIELARIEADRELQEIEAQRTADAAWFSKKINDTRRRIKELRKEIDCSEGLQKALAETTSDVNLLQAKLELVRAKGRNFQKNNIVRWAISQAEEEPEISSTFLSAKAELKAAQKELASIKEEGYKLMTEIDVSRRELVRVTEEVQHMKKREKIAEANVKNLHSDLFKAKSDLDSALISYERVKLIFCNLMAALQQLQVETMTAKKNAMLINDENKAIRMEIEKADSEIYVAEVRLGLAMKELERVKALEATGLEKLRCITEGTARTRATLSLWSSKITISKFEYTYLTSRAEPAKEVADKKVAAAQAWITAMDAEEKEISIEIERIQKELNVFTGNKEEKLRCTKKSLAVGLVAEERKEPYKWRKTRSQ